MRLDGEHLSIDSDCSRERHAILTFPGAHIDNNAAYRGSAGKKPMILRLGKDILKHERPMFDGVSIVVETWRVGKSVSTKPMHPHSLPILDQHPAQPALSPPGREYSQNRTSYVAIQGIR